MKRLVLTINVVWITVILFGTFCIEGMLPSIKNRRYLSKFRPVVNTQQLSMLSLIKLTNNTSVISTNKKNLISYISAILLGGVILWYAEDDGNKEIREIKKILDKGRFELSKCFMCDWFRYYIKGEDNVADFYHKREIDERLTKLLAKSDHEQIITIIDELTKNKHYACNTYKPLIKALTKVESNSYQYTDYLHKKLIPLIQQNFDPFCDHALFRYLLIDIMNNDSYVAQELLPSIKLNLKKISDNWDGRKFLETICESNGQIAQEIALYIVNNQLCDMRLFNQIMKKFSCNEQIENILSDDQYMINELEGQLKLLIYCKHCKSHSLKQKRKKFNTPSHRHIEKNLDWWKDIFFDDIFRTIFNDQGLRRISNEALKQEKILLEEGYETFYHGRRRTHEFPAKIYALLYAFTTNQPVDNDFIFTHIRKPVTNKEELLCEQARREYLINHDDYVKDLSKTWRYVNPPNVLFMNRFFLGNANPVGYDTKGNSSFYYMEENSNQTSRSDSIESIFTMFNLDFVYEEFREELLEQQERYNLLNKHGQMLLIGIKPNKLERCVYPTKNYGPKTSFTFSEIGSIDDITTILKYLNKYPLDHAQFGLAATFDELGGLNSKDMKILVLDPADICDKKMCDEKTAQLFEKIRLRIS